MKTKLAGARMAFALSFLALSLQAQPIKVLIVDGQNNHDWKATTPMLRQILEETKLFAVDVATAPAKGGDMGAFKPEFSKYKVIVSNYNGERWSKETEAAFVKFVQAGGGFVPVHAANNSFPDWPEYNRMIGVGGWGGRNEKSGPLLRWREGKWVQDTRAGSGGHHGAQHSFLMVTRAADHPVMKGLPEQWMHATDELYDSLRGPAEGVTVLASAMSSKDKGGTGEDEPLLMALNFGRGRVFHTALGHAAPAILCQGFTTTLQRGTEWAATGRVTQKVPANFPTSDTVSARAP